MFARSPLALPGGRGSWVVGHGSWVETARSSGRRLSSRRAGRCADSIDRVTTIPTILDIELVGGRWDGHFKRVHAGSPPPSLRMVLCAELPVTEAGEYWPTTSVYWLDDDGPVRRYRHSHDE